MNRLQSFAAGLRKHGLLYLVDAMGYVEAVTLDEYTRRNDTHRYLTRGTYAEAEALGAGIRAKREGRA